MRIVSTDPYHSHPKGSIMPREATVTPEQTFEVADALQAEGIRPTLREVCARLGRGSMSTINGHMQRWREARGRPSLAQPILPPALQRSLMDFIATEVAAARAPLDAELAEQLQIAADLAAESERQANALEESAAEIAALESQRAAAEGRAKQLDLELTAAKADAARERQAAEAARTELARVVVRLESLGQLQSDLSAVREKLEHERLGRVEAEQRVAVLAARQKDLEARLADMKVEVERANARAERARERLDQLTERLPAASENPQAGKAAGTLPPRTGAGTADATHPPRR